MDLLVFLSLASIVTVIGQIRIAQQSVWRVLFRVFPINVYIVFIAFVFSVFAVIRQIILFLASIFSAFSVIGWIRFAQWWVSWRWVRLWILWYVRFTFLLWQFCWLCQWRGIWRFCSNRSQVQLWCCYVCCVCTNRSRFQRWWTYQKLLVPKVLIFSPNFRSSFIAIVLIWTCHTHSYRCCFSKNMIWRQPIGSIHWPSNLGCGVPRILN